MAEVDSASPETSWPRISVVMPVRNEEKHLESTVRQLLAQDYPADRFEILIVDGCSTDRTRACAERLAERHDHLRVLTNPKRLSSAARNIGVREATGDLILIVDGHCELDGPRYLREVAGAFERSAADCLGRPQPLDVTNASLTQRAIAAGRSSWLGHHPASFIYAGRERFAPAKSVAVAYRREVFEKVGYFDETFDACEDVELNHRVDRAGLRCYFTPSIAARYVPRPSLVGLFRQMSRYGRGRVRLYRKHPDTFSFSSFAPAVWLIGIVLGPLASLAWGPLWLVYGFSLLAYLSLVLFASLQVVSKQHDLRFLWLVPLVLVTVHAGTGYGIVSEWFREWRGGTNESHSRTRDPISQSIRWPRT